MSLIESKQRRESADVQDATARRHPVSLADVAEAAGTSTAVVSYVLNDGPRPVAADTRRRVLEEIDRLGYRPNRIARALRSSRSTTLGLLLPDITNAFFSDLARAFETAAFERGYLSFVGNARFDPERGRSYFRAFSDLQVDGIAVTNLTSGGGGVMRDMGIPTVFLHHKTHGRPGDLVGFDEAAAGRIAASVVVSQSVDHLVVVTGIPESGPVAVRTDAFDAAVADHATFDSVHRITTAFARSDAADAFAAFLETHPVLSNVGVFAATDEQALGVLHAATAHHRSIPDDVVVIGGEGTTTARFAAPGLSSIDVPIGEMASNALDLLEVRMRNGDTGEASVTLDVSFTHRGTTRCGDPS